MALALALGLRLLCGASGAFGAFRFGAICRQPQQIQDLDPDVSQDSVLMGTAPRAEMRLDIPSLLQAKLLKLRAASAARPAQAEQAARDAAIYTNWLCLLCFGSTIRLEQRDPLVCLRLAVPMS